MDAVKSMRKNKTVTQEKLYWLFPSRGKKSLYGPVSDMNFTSLSTQKKGMDKEIAGDERIGKKRKKSAQIPKPTEKEIEGFYEKLSKMSQQTCHSLYNSALFQKIHPKVIDRGFASAVV